VIEQIGIALTGVVAVAFAQSDKPTLRRWAPVFGLLGQPFWFWAAMRAEQWGVFAVSVLYALAWARGFYAFWIRR
jgi:hypothetical protein